jgi:hypothetical protein
MDKFHEILYEDHAIEDDFLIQCHRSGKNWPYDAGSSDPLFSHKYDEEEWGRLCGLVLRVPAYRSRDPGFDSRRYDSQGHGGGILLTSYNHAVHTSQETRYVPATKPNWLMPFVEAVTVYCENHM